MFVSLSIVVVWGVLLGAAYGCRVMGRLSRGVSISAVTGCYLVLSGLALAWLGPTWRGGAGVFGMLLPYAVAIGIILTVPTKV